MKGKIALASALAAFVTVGGVYATWTFAEENVKEASTTVNVAMTGLEGKSEKGTLSVTVTHTGGFTLAVDDSNNDHLPEAKKTGTVIITFTPSISAPEEVKAKGIDVQFSISYAPYAGGPESLAQWTYGGTQIFDVTTDADAPVHLAKTKATKQENGSFVWTISADQIGIDLTAAMKNVSIDTLDKYNAMNAELAKGHFVLTASECTTVHNT